MEKREDRRSIRSKRLIVNALRELILEKDFHSITVTDIVERADIGRATFYAHFEDKADLNRYMFGLLLAQIEQEIEATLVESSNPAQYLIPSLALFKIAEEKHRWFKLNASKMDIGLNMLIQPLINRMRDKLDGSGLIIHDEQHIAMLFLISGLVAILEDWVIRDMPYPPEQMDKQYQLLAEPIINTFDV